MEVSMTQIKKSTTNFELMINATKGRGKTDFKIPLKHPSKIPLKHPVFIKKGCLFLHTISIMFKAY